MITWHYTRCTCTNSIQHTCGKRIWNPVQQQVADLHCWRFFRISDCENSRLSESLPASEHFSALEVLSPHFIVELLGKTLDQSTTEQAIDNNGVLVARSIVERCEDAVIVNAAVQYLHSVFIAHWDIKPLPPASLPFVGNKAHWLWCSGGTQGVFLAEFVQPEFWDWFNLLNMKHIQKGYERIQKAKRRLKCEHSLRYFWMYLSWWFFCICKGLCKDKSCNSGLCSEFHGCMEEVEGGRPWYVRSWQNIRGDCVKGWALTDPFKEDIHCIMYIHGILYRI